MIETLATVHWFGENRLPKEPKQPKLLNRYKSSIFQNFHIDDHWRLSYPYPMHCTKPAAGRTQWKSNRNRATWIFRSDHCRTALDDVGFPLDFPAIFSPFYRKIGESRDVKRGHQFPINPSLLLCFLDWYGPSWLTVRALARALAAPARRETKRTPRRSQLSEAFLMALPSGKHT